MANDAGSSGEITIGQAQKVLEALARHSGDCVILSDLDGRILKWNAACEELFGWSAREVLGERLPHVPEEQRLRVLKELRELAASGMVAERDFESLRKDGSRPVIRVTAIPVHDEDGDVAGLLGIGREMLGDDRLERRREEFAAFIGEGLSEPLRAIVSAGELLTRPEIASDVARRTTLAALVARRARDASRLVDDLLLSTRIASGQLILDREPTDLGALVTQAVADVEGDEHRVIVDFAFGSEPVLVDTERVRRALRVLVQRALDGAPDGRFISASVTYATGRVRVDIGEDSRHSGAEESDSHGADGPEPGPDGGEMPLEAGADFELHLAGAIAEAHGGRVLVKDGPGQGISFVLVLPVT